MSDSAGLTDKVVLEERRYSADEWNEKVTPLVESGALKEVPNENSGFMYFGQVFGGTLEDEKGNRFRCVAWDPPGGKQHVIVRIV